MSGQQLCRCSGFSAKPWRTCQKQAIYAASRINQLRKSSSAASQLRKANKISDLRVTHDSASCKALFLNGLRRHSRTGRCPQLAADPKRSLARSMGLAPHPKSVRMVQLSVGPVRHRFNLVGFVRSPL
jgi:hypothetical protein